MNYEHYDSQTGRCKRCGEGPVSCVCPPVMLSVVEGKSQEERDRLAYRRYIEDGGADHPEAIWRGALAYRDGRAEGQEERDREAFEYIRDEMYGPLTGDASEYAKWESGELGKFWQAALKYARGGE